MEVNLLFLLCFTLYLRTIFQVQGPRGGGAYIWRGLYKKGLIFGILRYPLTYKYSPRKEGIFVVCLVSEVSVFWRLVKTKRNMKRFFEFTKFRCYLGQGTAIRRVLQLVAREGKLELT